MNVKIIRIDDGKIVSGRIFRPPNNRLPSLTDGWRFNFRGNTKAEHLQTYALVCNETPDIVEGCLSFKMRRKVEPYMAYIEIAHHNQGSAKKYENVAGCLIAFACRLSIVHGKGAYKGWLAFDVMEQNKNNEIKLLALYCVKYGALRFGDTGMVIPPETGEQLILKFLNDDYEE